MEKRTGLLTMLGVGIVAGFELIEGVGFWGF